MNSRFQKALLTISVLAILAPMLTVSYNQANALVGEVRFVGQGTLICPDSSQFTRNIMFNLLNRADISDWIIYKPNDRQDGMEGDFGQVEISGTSENPNGFTVRGVEVRDEICNSNVPTDITIRGYCDKNTMAIFQSTNGQRAEFTIHGRMHFPLSSNEVIEDPICSNIGKNPSDVDASIGKVEPGHIPQPRGDDNQQIRPGDDTSKSAEDTSKSAEDTSGSNDLTTTDSKQSCPSNGTVDEKTGECKPE